MNQSYIRNSYWFDQYSKFYESISNERALVTIEFVEEKFVLLKCL